MHLQRFSKELLSSQLFSHYCRNINLSAPALHPSKWRLSIYSATLSPPHSCSAKTIFFAGKYLPPRKSDECPQGASQTWAISQVGLMICPQHVEFFFPYIIMKKIFEEGREEEKKAMTWPPDWLLILGTQERRSWRGTKNSMETGESCSGNDVSIWWLMERYDVFGIADLMVRHLRRSRVDTVFVHHPSRLWSSFFSSRNIVQLSSSSKCNFRTLEGANDLGHFDTTDVSKVSKGGI